jgi:sporulation protein YlmC with PRC-barrel domain
MQDPEVNDVTLNDERDTVSVEIRIVRVSSCCNDEMKEYTFSTEVEIPAEIVEKMKDIPVSDDVTAQDDGCDQLEEGGGRYAKSYYGYTMQVGVYHGSDKLGTFEVTDKVAASEMDELT